MRITRLALIATLSTLSACSTPPLEPGPPVGSDDLWGDILRDEARREYLEHLTTPQPDHHHGHRHHR